MSHQRARTRRSARRRRRGRHRRVAGAPELGSAAGSLWRNREFNLLWVSQYLSDVGDSAATLAFPLLVLAITGSPVQAGLVATIVQVTSLTCRLPAGVMADRVSRRRAMLGCDLARLVAFAGCGAAVVTGHASLVLVIVVAAVDAAGGTMFTTAESAALRSIVPAAQLSAAVARNEARSYATSLVGPALGGLLFGLGHALPFFVNALSYLASITGVALIRRPLQAKRQETASGYAGALAEGLTFVFRNPSLRAVLLIAAPLNFAFIGVVFTVIISLQRHGTPPAVIGLAETILGVGGLLGALAAPTLQRRLRLTALARTICWSAASLLVLSALLTPSVAAAVPVALTLLLAPACIAALFGYQASITPDELQGRVLSVIFLGATPAAAAAPVLAGAVVSTWGSPAATLIFAAAVSCAAITATLSKGIREIRPLNDTKGKEASAA